MSKSIILNLQTDTNAIDNRLNVLSTEIRGLKVVADQILMAIVNGMNESIASMYELRYGIADVKTNVITSVGDLKAAIMDVSSQFASSVQNVFGETISKFEDWSDNQDTKEWQEKLSDRAFEMGWSLVLESFGKAGRGTPQRQSRGSAAGRESTGQLLLPPGNSIDSKSEANNGIVGFTAGGVGLMDSGLTDAISDITEKFKGSTAATWLQNAATTAWKGISTAATAVTTAFGAAMNFLTSPIGLVVIGITALIAIIVLLIANWDTVSAKAQEVWGFVQAKFAEFDAFLKNVFAKDWTEQFGAFGNVLNGFFAGVEGVWNAIKTVFNGIVTFVKSVFAGDWKGAWDGIVGIFSGIWEGLVAIIKWPINGIIGLINGFIGGIVDGINRVIMLLNCLSFDIPDWEIFGDLAGKKFGFNLELIDAPQIPYLAKGAVLPANKPFLAMVGDQKHGTNVEAPLATIQEAVAVVMEDMVRSNMAGHEAASVSFMKSCGKWRRVS